MDAHLAECPLDRLQLPVLAVNDVRQGVNLFQGLALGVALQNAVIPIADLEGLPCAADEILAQQGSLDPAKK